jgi:hypothetical protein
MEKKAWEYWEDWAGETKWSRIAKEIDIFGGYVKTYGVPQSASPFCFAVYNQAGIKIASSQRLKDLVEARNKIEGTGNQIPKTPERLAK